MKILQSQKQKPSVKDPRFEPALNVAIPSLKETVETIAIPRHYVAEKSNNQFVASWIEGQFDKFGYQTFRQGEFDNIATQYNGGKPAILIGAHYDSMPETPGADDNGSAVAAMLGCAKAIAEQAPEAPVCFVAFNREEDSLMGSRIFVADYALQNLKLREVHVLEMVGYCDHSPGSQKLPQGLPVNLIRDRGDFLALIANRTSNRLVKPILSTARTYLPEFPVLGLKVFCGLEKRFTDLRRSDHAPFWDAGIPAMMWTDTSEFRNSNYHEATDTPDTLDYEFLQRVTQLLILRVLTTMK